MSARVARLVIIGLAALAAGACGDGEDPVVAPATTTTSSAPANASCEAPTFSVEYPGGWHVNDVDGDVPQCRWLHPEPFEVPRATEATHLAIHVRYEPTPLDRLVDAAASAGDVVDRDESEIDGRRAVRLATETSGEALLPEGTRVVSWFVDTGPRTFVASTTSAADGAGGDRFSEHVDVLDAVVSSLDVTAPFACSAVGMTPQLHDATALSEPVRTTAEALLEAAVACDFDALSRLARAGTEPFTFSFGGGDDARAFWVDAEEAGGEPLRELASVLSMPHARRDAGGGVQYVWPEEYATEGEYLGHRVGIAEDGEWLFFVAGD